MKPQILSIDEIHQLKKIGTKMLIWFEERPFIKYGYRIGFRTISDLALSAIRLHNETMNFWTHFLSAIWILSELF